jgi:hypothetical protein
MRRKIVLLISALLIVFDIGLTLAAFNAGERRLTATLEAVATLVSDYLRPIPRLGG